MKILHLEDNPRDAALVRDVLAVDWPDCAIHVAVTRDDFLRELAGNGYDLIISDYRLPGFNGLEALELVRERAPEVPFIFFSGTLGEERAVEAVRAGAADYVIKDRMQRLPVSVQRVMRESTELKARRRAEGALAQEQYLMRILMDHVPDHVYFKDAESRFISVSRSLARRHGLEPMQLRGKTDSDLFTREHAHRARDDERRIMRTGEVILDQEEQETWSDGKITWVSTTKLPLRDVTGRIVGTFGVSRDITEKKKLEEQFLRAQRLESLGMLSAGIAHDLNNILAPVLMGAPLLRIRASHPSDLRVLDAIESSAGRGAALVRQILSFAHGASGNKVLIQAKHLLRDIAGFVEQTFPKNIGLEEDIPNDLWTVQGNPTQLHQVLLNLCVNARDAMPRGGSLRLSAANRVLDAAASQVGQNGVPGAYLVFEVADTGTGIPPEIVERIWDPFFTTKAEGKGTGLGLATVRGIAANHEGFVRVESVQGRGTTFQVFLPASEQGAADAAAVTIHPFPIRGQGELVLVVDDEDSIRELVTAVLARYGYRVLVAANGIEAMALYTPRAEEVALVITDISMPEMGGGDLSLALSRLNPDVKILFMSGAGVAPGAEDNIPPGARLLIKPFAVERLVTVVHEALEGRPV